MMFPSVSSHGILDVDDHLAVALLALAGQRQSQLDVLAAV